MGSLSGARSRGLAPSSCARLEIKSASDTLRADLVSQMIHQTRTMIITLITVVVAIAAMSLFQG